MRRIEAVTGRAADALVRERFDALERSGRGRRRPVDRRCRRTASRRSRTSCARRSGGSRRAAAPGLPKPGELAAGAVEVVPGVRLVAAALPADSMDALKASARDVSGVLGSGVIALALDADEPQLFVTVSDDLVARGISAGDLVTAAMPALAGRGGGRPNMAQGRGTRREGVAEALAAIRAHLETGA